MGFGGGDIWAHGLRVETMSRLSSNEPKHSAAEHIIPGRSLNLVETSSKYGKVSYIVNQVTKTLFNRVFKLQGVLKILETCDAYAEEGNGWLGITGLVDNLEFRAEKVSGNYKGVYLYLDI